MHAIPRKTKTVYFWQAQRSSKLSMLYRYKEAKKERATAQQTVAVKTMKTPEVQKRIVEAIKSQAIDIMDFTSGQFVQLNTLYSYLPEISRNDLFEALTQWDIQVHNGGIFIPGKYFD